MWFKFSGNRSENPWLIRAILGWTKNPPWCDFHCGENLCKWALELSVYVRNAMTRGLIFLLFGCRSEWERLSNCVGWVLIVTWFIGDISPGVRAKRLHLFRCNFHTKTLICGTVAIKIFEASTFPKKILQNNFLKLGLFDLDAMTLRKQ